MPELAVSSWSLHRELGPRYSEPAAPGAARVPDYPWGTGNMTLLDLPARLAETGITNLEICHFHFPRTDPEYVRDLRSRLAEAGVVLTTLLIDSGDITNPDAEARARDIDWIKSWIDVAAEAGARRVRIIAGQGAPEPEAMKASLDGFKTLTDYAQARGVGVITENWFALTMRPENLLTLLDGMRGKVGLCGDFGNYRGPTKYEDLKAILPKATSIHAKAEFTGPGEVNRTDFEKCLGLARDAGFSGTYVLIFDGPGEEWPSLAQEAALVTPYL
jgi:sugar phosphate isomerase/epimerase